MEILEPHRSVKLIGHETALAEVAAAYNSGRMHHAWMITGAEGIGKTTLAYHIANYVLSGGKNKIGELDIHEKTTRLVMAESHPDLYVLRRSLDEKTGVMKDSIAVEAARKLAPFLRLTATHGSWRAAIIDEAQALNRFGQNAILKVIEEPPPRCLILITVTTPGILLPTIRSRCRLLPLQPLATKALQSLLENHGLQTLSPPDQKLLLELSGGSVGFALKLISSGVLPLYTEMINLLDSMPNLSIAKMHGLADQVAKKSESDGFSALTQLLLEHLTKKAKNMALAGATPQQLDIALGLCDKIKEIFAMADHGNLDRKLALINAITEIRNAA